MKTVLISGAGIAGPALALRLHHHGFTPTIVERARTLRPGGQAVDIRGVALDVMARLGLLEEARAVRTRMRGMSVLASDGTETHRTEEATYSSGRLDNGDIELLREDLVRMLYDRTRTDVEHLFGDTITRLTDRGDGVHVEFAHAAPRTFDLVVGADGLHSTVRRLAFGPEHRYAHHLGSHLAVFGTGNFLDLDDWQVWLRDGDKGFGIMPVRDNTELRVAFGFESVPEGHTDLREEVVKHLTTLSWHGPRLARLAAEAPDFYCDAMAQIRMPSWSHGRVTLLGDAAHCPSPLSGQGTSLALAGAYVLAESLAEHPGHTEAFAHYESRMRPFVALNQALATENPGGPAAEESVDRAKNALALDG
ncbi:FAD-dependent monooxygenase [Streptomyces roseirectus]|uniref:FAD-dependent monooxygenase n=1 Tax=Streptomyces roseirectus TaxID=2768066 RepID=A0A7H0IQI0_9ACTN|nr:FAD-dependent monooxygenase [Streptomyces roseirectus]QNP75046.1 FAD-dependent monooxygenase [Streptomyces roseirectus]